MFIKTVNKEYFIVQTILSSPTINTYIVKENSADPDQLYIMNEIKNRKMIEYYLEDFMSIEHTRTLSDFISCFALESNLYVLFQYHPEKSLSKYLTHSSRTLDKRLDLAIKILFEMTAYTDLPLFIQKTILQPDNINIDENENIYFNYFIPSTPAEKKFSKEDLFTEIGILLNQLFHQELEKKHQKLHIILTRCSKSLYHSIPEIIQDLKDVKASKPHSIKEKLFQKKKKWKSAVKKWVIVGILLAVGIYLYRYSLRFKAQTTNMNVENPVSQIGDRTIIDVDSKPADEQEKEEPTSVYIDIQNSEQQQASVQQPTSSFEPENTETEDQTKFMVTDPNAAEEQSSAETNPGTTPEQSSVESNPDALQDQPEYDLYTVQKGEWLVDICRKHYGTIRYFHLVSQFNGLEDPSDILPGTLLKLPSTDYLEEQLKDQ